MKSKVSPCTLEGVFRRWSLYYEPITEKLLQHEIQINCLCGLILEDLFKEAL